jgi:hypothetical protein
MGGEGLAAPPLICNFTIADNSFAIVCFLIMIGVQPFHRLFICFLSSV